MNIRCWKATLPTIHWSKNIYTNIRLSITSDGDKWYDEKESKHKGKSTAFYFSCALGKTGKHGDTWIITSSKNGREMQRYVCKCVPSRQNGKDSNKWHQNWKRRCYKWYWNGGEPYGLHLHLVFHLSSVCRKTSAGEELRAVRKHRNKGNQSNRLNNSSLVIKHNQSSTSSSFSRFIENILSCILWVVI